MCVHCRGVPGARNADFYCVQGQGKHRSRFMYRGRSLTTLSLTDLSDSLGLIVCSWMAAKHLHWVFPPPEHDQQFPPPNHPRPLYSAEPQLLQCWCSEEGDSDYGRHGTATCGMRCSGSVWEECGDSWKMSIYRSREVKPSTHLGCFTDRGGEERIFADKARSSSQMTSEVTV